MLQAVPSLVDLVDTDDLYEVPPKFQATSSLLGTEFPSDPETPEEPTPTRNFVPEGPQKGLAEELHKTKYRLNGETFHDATARVANTLADDPTHFSALKAILRGMRFLPGGRVQAAVGAPRRVTPYNCFVSGVVEDSMDSIMERAAQAAQTMRLGGGIGYDFSLLRPRGDRIVSLDSVSSGPVSFMGIFDAICKTISSSGHRRGAQMGVLRVDHPDIEEFIHAKQNNGNLTAFNISVGVTDEFMEAVDKGLDFPLRFKEKVYKTVDARALWDEIMRSTWEYAEPGVLFLDTINKWNPLYYCEEIQATNPCAEQPLPPNGACLLGSFNLTTYLKGVGKPVEERYFDYRKLVEDIPHVVRAMDNVVDRAIYPMAAQEREAKSKRRMGLGITGLSNAGEFLGHPYGSTFFLKFQESVMTLIRDEVYMASSNLAREKGVFPLYDTEKYTKGLFFQTLSPSVRERIRKNGIRNSHLLSIAPTGTISLAANNVSSGIEPVFLSKFERTVQTTNGPKVEIVEDYGTKYLGVKARTANDCSVDDHLNTLVVASNLVDSAVSKTCNIGDDVTWEEFKNVYWKAWKGGAKGCTTFRAAGKREGILREVKDVESGDTSIACEYDPTTGNKTCDE